jgi:hypothetical protein
MEIKIIIDDGIINFFRRIFSRKNIIFGLATLLFCAGLFIFSATITKLHILQPGAVVSASELNENFEYLEDKITTLAPGAWQQSGDDIYYNSGNVGIGTTSPEAGLHLKDKRIRIEDSYSPDIEFFVGAEKYGEIWGTTSGLHIGPTTAGSDLTLYSRPSGGGLPAVMTISEGNVGIGTTSPGYPLTMGGGAYCTGTVWTDVSSRKYKENIRNLTNEEAIETINKLNPVKFNYKTNKDEEYLGFIAEDVPDLVAMNDRNGLSPMDIAAVLVKAVQEQQETIKTLKARIEILEGVK